MTETRTHNRCGQPMLPAVLGKNSPTPSHRSQPVWMCGDCAAWEPRDGWRGRCRTTGTGSGGLRRARGDP